MRTKTIVVIEQGEGGHILGVFSNDPNLVVKTVKYGEVEECGSCGSNHQREFHGDCRDDDNRLVEID